MRAGPRCGVAVLGAIWGTLTATAAGAQQAPPQIDAGTIGRENLRTQRSLERQTEEGAQGPTVVAPGRSAPGQVAPGGPVFVLKEVVFDRSAFLTQEELAALAAPYTGRPIDFSEVQKLVNAVNALYAERGIVTGNAGLPPQTLKDGVLRIQLVEGRVGKVTVEGGDRSLDYVRRRIQIDPGSVVDVPRLSGEIATINRTGETQLRTVLQPGTEFGLTDVTLSLTEPARNSLQLFGDNFGVPTVGRGEGGALFQHYGMLGLDDRLKLYAVHSRGNSAENASYTFDATPWGGRLGLSYGRSDIRIVNGPFKTLDVRGQSQLAGVNLAQPIYGDASWLLVANLGGSLTSSITKQDTSKITSNLTEKVSAGFTLGYYGETFAASVTPTYSHATSALRVVDSRLSFDLFGGNASASAQLPYDFVVQALGSWQVSSVALLPGDQLFQIGGPTTIRGYPSGVAAGGSGYYGNFELHRAAGFIEGLDLFAFVDHGRVFSTFPKETSLTSAGVGMSYTYNRLITAELSAGFPLTQVVERQPDYAVYGRLIFYAF